jgi:hypothetical protein
MQRQTCSVHRLLWLINRLGMPFINMINSEKLIYRANTGRKLFSLCLIEAGQTAQAGYVASNRRSGNSSAGSDSFYA